jgi:hypothetical protein
LEDKNKKIAKNEQSAHANLIVVMLKGIFYTAKGILMSSGLVKMGQQNRQTLGVRNCTSRLVKVGQIVLVGIKGSGLGHLYMVTHQPIYLLPFYRDHRQ